MAYLGPSSICGRAGRIQVLGKGRGRERKKPVSLVSEDNTKSLYHLYLIHLWRQAKEKLDLQLEEQRVDSKRTIQMAVR